MGDETISGIRRGIERDFVTVGVVFCCVLAGIRRGIERLNFFLSSDISPKKFLESGEELKVEYYLITAETSPTQLESGKELKVQETPTNSERVLHSHWNPERN